MTVDTTPPATPTLRAPANASATNDNTPTFDWNDVTGATQYRIQIDQDADFSSPEADTTGTVSTYTPVLGLADGTIYWRVSAGDGVDLWGAYSAVWQVTIDTKAPAAPVLLFPANGAKVLGTPTFVWQAVATATYYQFQIDNNADFSSPVHTSRVLRSTSYGPPTHAAGIYYWRVRARDAAGNWGPWSTPRIIAICRPSERYRMLNG